MDIIEMLDGITPLQIEQMICDYKRLFPRGEPFPAQSRSLSKALPDTDKYRIVARTVSDASLAARTGEQGHCLAGGRLAGAAAVPGLFADG